MNSRKRLLAALSGDETDRIPITEIGVWPETRLRWINEGMPDNISVDDYFGLDKIEVFTFDSSLQIPVKTIEDNDDFITTTDSNGCTREYHKNSYGASKFIKASIINMDSWKNVRNRLKPDLSRLEGCNTHFGFGHKLPGTMKERYLKTKNEDIFTVYSPTEPCWFFLNLLGEEDALINFASDPDFAESVFSDYTDFNLKQLEEVYSAGYTFDALWVFSDLCYKNGMLFSPKFYRERLLPYHRSFFNRAATLDMKVIYHCDGYIGEFLPLLIDAGVDCVQPLEVRAGNDIRDYIRQYPGKISYMGNINADALASGREVIENEVKNKVLEAKKTRRYIYHSDHSVPDTVSLENFKFSIELAFKYGVY